MYKLQEKPSTLKREHPTLQKIKFSIFVGHFCPPGSGSGSVSTDLIVSGSNPNPIRTQNNGIIRDRVRGQHCTVLPLNIPAGNF
jgi:hypothetical protein